MQLPTTVSGVVQRNEGRGRELGYPTANLSYNGNLRDGVYFGTVSTVSQEHLPALIFIGSAPTFNDTKRRLEAYILDFSGDLYDTAIVVSLQMFHRPNIKFDSMDKLIIQMKDDEQKGRDYFAENGYN